MDIAAWMQKRIASGWTRLSVEGRAFPHIFVSRHFSRSMVASERASKLPKGKSAAVGRVSGESHHPMTQTVPPKCMKQKMLPGDLSVASGDTRGC